MYMFYRTLELLKEADLEMVRNKATILSIPSPTNHPMLTPKKPRGRPKTKPESTEPKPNRGQKRPRKEDTNLASYDKAYDRMAERDNKRDK